MEERAWKITLADGTSLGSLKLNGNNFISTTEVTEEMFEDILRDIPAEELEQMALKAQLDYLSMMVDPEL